MVNPPTETKSFGTSGWTPEELAALDRLKKYHNTDASKLLRKLVMDADKERVHLDKLVREIKHKAFIRKQKAVS